MTERGRLKLHGLDPEAQYRVTDIDVGKPQQMTGPELMKKGLPVSITDQPGAVVIVYQRAK